MKQKLKFIDLAVINEPMAPKTSFKLGGNAKYFCQPTNIEQLKTIIKHCQSSGEKYHILGNGTNTVFRDGGYNGVVISLANFEKTLKQDGELIKASAGTSLFAINRFLRENALSGLEWSYGIPASIGGAVYMNAGAYGGEINNFVEKVEVLAKNRRRIIYKNDIEYGYRYSSFQSAGDIILNVWLSLKKSNKEEIERLQNYYYCERKIKQPLNFPSAGSVFKRENNIIPAKIIDKLDLKGAKIRGVEVSKKHAGFIVKTGDAKTEDLEELINHIKDTVFKQEGITLHTEIEIIGDK